MHRNSLLLFDRYALGAIPRDATVLELGPAGAPSELEQRASGRCAQWLYADLEDVPVGLPFGPGRVDLRMPDEYTVPIEDASIDVVISANVIEHVRRVWDWMTELSRICRPGGLVITVGPLSWPYHAVPVDCWRIHPDGMRALSEHAGLAVEVCEVGALVPTVTRRSFPGESLNERPYRSLRTIAQRIVGWPMPTSYDVVTVARKH